MKKCFEIEFCQERKQAPRCKRLAGPKQKWSEERSNKNGRGKIGRQSSCVFQAC